MKPIGIFDANVLGASLGTLMFFMSQNHYYSLLGAALFVYVNTKDRAIGMRLAIVIASVFIGGSVGPELAASTGYGINTVHLVVTGLVWLVYDGAASLFENKTLVAKAANGVLDRVLGKAK